MITNSNNPVKLDWCNTCDDTSVVNPKLGILCGLPGQKHGFPGKKHGYPGQSR